MVDLCEFLEVALADTKETVIEKCGDYNNALDGFVLVLESSMENRVKDWIRQNMRRNVDHCVKMFETQPASTYKFLMKCRGLADCTTEFVQDAGGIQQFLDKYAKLKGIDVSEGHEEPPHQTVTDESEQELVSVSPEQEPEQEPEQIQEQTPEPAQEAIEPEVPEQGPETVASQPIITKAPPVIEHKTTVIHNTVKNVMDYDPALIEKISDGQIAESVQKLKELNSQIALGGLNPKFVLSDSDLESIYGKLCTYPPDVFKSFVLAYLKSVSSETERFRISAVMDDFLNFVRG